MRSSPCYSTLIPFLPDRWGDDVSSEQVQGAGMHGPKLVQIHTIYIHPRERCLFSKLFSKLDLPLFKGPCLSILHQNKARVGAWGFLSSQVYCSPKHSIHHYNHGLSAMFYII